MGDRTLGPHDQARRLPTPSETEFLRDLVGFAPGRFTLVDRDWVLYVREDGDDDNPGTDPAKPLATIQAAVNKVPFSRKEKVTINVGPGEFEGFILGDMSGFGVPTAPGTFQNLWIQGTMRTFEPATGVAEGQAAGGGTDSEGRYTLTKPTGAPDWTPGDLVGKKLVKVSGAGTTAYIVANDATTLTVGVVHHYSGTYDGTTRFQIQDWATRINRGRPELFGGVSWYLPFLYVYGSVSIKDIDIHPNPAHSPQAFYIALVDHIYFEGCRFKGEASNHDWPLSIQTAKVFDMYQCLFQSVGGDTGAAIWGYIGGLAYIRQCCFFESPLNGDAISMSGFFRGSYLYDSYLDGNSKAEYGLVLGSGNLAMVRVFLKDFTKSGIYCPTEAIDLSMNTVTIDGCGEHGVHMSQAGVGGFNLSGASGITIKNCGGDAIRIHQGRVTISNLGGSGNTGYGLRIGPGVTAVVGSGMAVTGTAGDFRIGVTDGDWGTDLGSPGDSVPDLNSMSGIVRE